MSLDLRHIPCPAGDTCTAFQCIFGHAKDKAPDVPKPAEPKRPEAPQFKANTIAAAGQAAAAVTSADPQGPPRKRTKVEHSDAVPPVPRPSLAKTKTPSSSSSSLPRPASPPRSRKDITAASNAKRPTAAKVVKAESLNPRLIKSSPASHEIRLKLVRMLHAEYTRLNREVANQSKAAGGDGDADKKLVLSDQELITMTLDDETAIAVGKSAVYTNVMKNRVMQYKRMNATQWREERKKKMMKEAGLTPSTVEKTIETGLTPAQEVEVLRNIITPIDRLSNHGYVPVVPSDEAVKSARDGKEAGHGWEKCDRCQQRFQVFPGRREEDGALTSGGECHFHWGKAYLPGRSSEGKASRPSSKRFVCCGEAVGESTGCCTGSHHVYKASDGKTLATVLNFAPTPENEAVPDDRAVCFDCEMCYTVHGMELVRLTAVSWPGGKPLLDVLVQPLGEILDLNSRYSGVWPDDMARAKPLSVAEVAAAEPKAARAVLAGEDGGGIRIVSSPEVARHLLFSLIRPSTPLMGHGLENDLNAVRIVHPTVVDTVLLYPHKAGLPFRHGLKMLMDHHLNKKIQQDQGPDSRGHDSAEDARAAGDLIRLRVAEEWGRMRRAGWKADGEKLAPPLL
ncbi:RNA exonuclease [Geosmithia morbida]|uniref:RNA exonuclease n=1 Tax=Geosmithia morbida TaxID=1094350 RepID=A0A9P4YQJ4_9HYPO|nr:RNA exonuclease [Geosmithia morbida]KAF4119977.1 RNA exonuclease [Geosmithia morbida]